MYRKKCDDVLEVVVAYQHVSTLIYLVKYWKLHPQGRQMRTLHIHINHKNSVDVLKFVYFYVVASRHLQANKIIFIRVCLSLWLYV